jgi:biopolymer transport protein ExbD
MEAPREPGRRRVTADLNLVPYIDLLTCMIAFLLITAVWTQVASLRANPRGQGANEEALPSPKLAVLVGEGGFNVVLDDSAQLVPLVDGRHDFAALGRALGALKAARPDQEDAEVSPEDAVRFETLVRTMDALIAAGFPAVSVNGARAAGL